MTDAPCTLWPGGVCYCTSRTGCRATTEDVPAGCDGGGRSRIRPDPASRPDGPRLPRLPRREGGGGLPGRDPRCGSGSPQDAQEAAGRWRTTSDPLNRNTSRKALQMTTTVPATTAPATYTDVAAALRQIATLLDMLSMADLPEPWISISIQPGGDTDDDEIRTAAIDTVAASLVGKPGETRRLSGGTFHHTALGSVGPVRLSIYDAVSDPATRELRAELARLRDRLGEGTEDVCPYTMDHTRELCGRPQCRES